MGGIGPGKTKICLGKYFGDVGVPKSFQKQNPISLTLYGSGLVLPFPEVLRRACLPHQSQGA